MVFYVLISVVFIAELVIAWAVISHFIKWGKTFREVSNFLEEARPQIKSIIETNRKISEQLVELAPIWVDNVKNAFTNFALKNIKSLLVSSLCFVIGKKIGNKMLKNK